MPNDANSTDAAQPDYDDLPWAPAAGRNAAPISAVLKQWLPRTGRVLELASGTGQHVCRFAREHPGLHWQPTDPAVEQCASINNRIQRAELSNVGEALAMPAEAEWPNGTWDVVLAINLVHIAAWTVTETILQSAGALLATSGMALFYGPYHRNGKATSPGNASFDASLRAQSPVSGIRALESLIAEGEKYGLIAEDVLDMPANNLFIRLKKRS
ncbi:MAG: class I SAM-dependent methyltransferase [Pseudomonadaceae bacterium]|nr:class I SAM-dependent methyltransferase [Pseudomonadaceae bacterium]